MNFNIKVYILFDIKVDVNTWVVGLWQDFINVWIVGWWDDFLKAWIVGGWEGFILHE